MVVSLFGALQHVPARVLIVCSDHTVSGVKEWRNFSNPETSS